MVLESYPQMILNLFIMQSLQIDEWLNIGSCVISALSVIIGFSDFLTTMTYGGIDVTEIHNSIIHFAHKVHIDYRLTLGYGCGFGLTWSLDMDGAWWSNASLWVSECAISL